MAEQDEKKPTKDVESVAVKPSAVPDLKIGFLPNENPPVAIGKGLYVVAKGKSVTTLKGIVADGAEITADHFTGGQVDFLALVQKRVIVKA